jgi:hypothetical protein
LAVVVAAAPASAQQTYFVSIGVSVGGLQSPYGGSCAGKTGAAAGLEAHAGRSFGALELSGSFTHVKNVAAEIVNCPTVPLILPDGVHALRSYDRGQNPGFDMVSLQGSYAPEALRYVRVHAGVGVETREGDLAVLTGATLRTPGAIRVNLGLNFRHFSTRYTQFQQTWQDGRVVSSEATGQGSSWRRYLAFSLGLEIGLPQPSH